MGQHVDVVVAGGGGFIGGHLAADLLSQGLAVRCVDIKPRHEWQQLHPEAENVVADLSLLDSAREAVRDAGQVYMLAADMGGMGFIENNKAACMMSVLTSTHMLKAAHEAGVERYFYSSSACVYAAGKQTDPNVTALKEEDAYPAQPEDGYGWEKLFTERMCRHFEEDYGFTSRVARYHNVYGPDGTWTGGREKAPAAVCRKVAEAVLSGEHTIEIWGDGLQTRSFMYIDDCLRGTQMIMGGDSSIPVNLGSSERTYHLDAPQGVRGRNSDNTLIRELYGWEPSIPLADGLEKTYAWVYDQVKLTRR
jgi:nucleoside-diphosphate-sugar epimerase